MSIPHSRYMGDEIDLRPLLDKLDEVLDEVKELIKAVQAVEQSGQWSVYSPD